ncbi:UNVERIFIED_CONTAM: putative P-loop ATPase and inactivated derivatives [Acetivibrio alkalicellulosi]
MITLQNDRQIKISAAGSRKANNWPTQELYWSEMVERLITPVRGVELFAEYLRKPKREQDDLKDVGGFVGGTLKDGRRKAANVSGRDIITLDLDNIPAGQTQEIIKRLEGIGCAYATYSTRKHEPVKPRLRVLLPIDRTVTADEYEPLTRKIASIIGIELCDPSTFEASRLMYWPSCCSDSQYVFHVGDRPFLSADGILSMYINWRDIAEWPEVPGAQQNHVKLAEKQGDPTNKTGIVGAFCRTYDIYSVIDKWLSGVYIECENSEERLTFSGGSTFGGAIIYNNGNFLYSHHATDPAGGKLCNSFDLVRYHKFGELDDEAKHDTPVNKLPSYVAMCELASSDKQVSLLLKQERYDEAIMDFASPCLAISENGNWMMELKINSSSGAYLKNTRNIEILLENDPQLSGKIKLNIFADRIMGFGPLPWAGRNSEEVFEWSEVDDVGLRMYIERVLGFRNRDMVFDAIMSCSRKNAFDPVVDYLNSLEWDGVKRLDTLFIDYLGAEDSYYTRSVTRKVFVAAVARAMSPGVKFDNITVIDGKQGIGKSTLLRKMARGWFSDNLNTVEGKEAAELLQGVWIIELGELSGLNRSETNAVKHFLSKQEDQYRAAYARRTERHPRRCVFFGTTNNREYLKDSTGNRRFWPISALVVKPCKDVFGLSDDDIDQFWGEAYCYWQFGEQLYLPRDLEIEAERRREGYMERDPVSGQIEEFLNKPIPEDWNRWSIDRRLMFWNGMLPGNDIKLVPRDRVCALEIWRECLRENRRTMTKSDSRRINSVLETFTDWEPLPLMRIGAEYGSQRGFKRKITVNFLES